MLIADRQEIRDLTAGVACPAQGADLVRFGLQVRRPGLHARNHGVIGCQGAHGRLHGDKYTDYIFFVNTDWQRSSWQPAKRAAACGLCRTTPSKPSRALDRPIRHSRQRPPTLAIECRLIPRQEQEDAAPDWVRNWSLFLRVADRCIFLLLARDE